MNKFNKLTLIGTSILALSAGAAAAQPARWVSPVEREASLSARIDAGVRSGDLNREEAARLRAEVNDITRLEARYRSDGFSGWEQSDLDRRMDALSVAIGTERTDNQGGMGWYGGRGWNDQRDQWVSINQRQVQLDRRIDRGVETGRLTRREATRLRADFNALARLERRYRVNGLTGRERADLDSRFDRLAASIRWEAQDGDRYGQNYRHPPR
jgi:hypothetical protein